MNVFDYQNNKYGQNTLKTPKNIALHMKRKQIKPNERKTKANENVSQTFRKHSANIPQTCRKRVANVSQTCRKHFAIMSENNGKNRYTDPENDIFYLYTYTHAHTTTERL